MSSNKVRTLTWIWGPAALVLAPACFSGVEGGAESGTPMADTSTESGNDPNSDSGAAGESGASSGADSDPGDDSGPGEPSDDDGPTNECLDGDCPYYILNELGELPRGQQQNEDFCSTPLNTEHLDGVRSALCSDGPEALTQISSMEELLQKLGLSLDNEPGSGSTVDFAMLASSSSIATRSVSAINPRVFIFDSQLVEFRTPRLCRECGLGVEDAPLRRRLG